MCATSPDQCSAVVPLSILHATSQHRVNKENEGKRGGAKSRAYGHIKESRVHSCAVHNAAAKHETTRRTERGGRGPKRKQAALCLGCITGLSLKTEKKCGEQRVHCRGEKSGGGGGRGGGPRTVQHRKSAPSKAHYEAVEKKKGKTEVLCFSLETENRKASTAVFVLYIQGRPLQVVPPPSHAARHHLRPGQRVRRGRKGKGRKLSKDRAFKRSSFGADSCRTPEKKNRAPFMVWNTVGSPQRQ